MDYDSKTPIIAEVDLSKVRLAEENEVGIDYFNEIDIWARMEFRSREQVNKLRQKKTLQGAEVLKSLSSIFYSVREKID